MDSLQGQSINSRYSIRNFLGSGAFSVVYRGVDQTKHKAVAIKVESHCDQQKLRQEAALMRELLQGVKGVPHLKWSGEFRDSYAAVMTLTGQNLEDMLSLCGGKFSVKTVTMMARQLLSRLRDIHARGIIHRDLKPDNVAIGMSKRSSELYIIDFGLSILAKQAGNTEEMGRFVGSLAFSSLNVLAGVQLSYRDDLESLCYLLLFLLKGTLPWTMVENLNPANIQQSSKAMKLKLPQQILCRDVPPAFGKILTYAKSLEVGEMPDYHTLKLWLRELAHKCNFTFDRKFDWTIRTRTRGDPTLGLEIMKANRRLREEHSTAKLFQSAAMEVPEDSSESTPLPDVRHIEPRLLPMHFPYCESKPKDDTLEDLTGPSLSDDIRDNKLPEYSPYGHSRGKEKRTLESKKKPSVTADLRAYLNSTRTSNP